MSKQELLNFFKIPLTMYVKYGIITVWKGADKMKFEKMIDFKDHMV